MLAQLEEIRDNIFDYIIIGGGTTGLTVAGRLVEDPNISVVVLEAGEAHLDDPKLLLTGTFRQTRGDRKYDWGYKTVPQTNCYNRECAWPRGKGLGGTSGLNLCLWTKPPAGYVDAWEKLGNPGWNWSDFRKYSMRSEHYIPPSEERLKEFEAHSLRKENWGTKGPVKLTDTYGFHDVEAMLFGSLEANGIRTAEDPYSGEISGKWFGLSTHNPDNRFTRSYAATAYYCPHEDQPNLKVLTQAHTSRILFSDTSNGNENKLLATGVEFLYGEQKYAVHVRKEIIVSAGTIASPQILELSGIGRRDVLEKVGIPIKLELPGVGENLQDHLTTVVAFRLKKAETYTSLDFFKDPNFALEQQQLQESNRTNLHHYNVFRSVSFIPLSAAFPDFAGFYETQVERWLEEQKREGNISSGLADQYDIQLKSLKDRNIPDIEILAYPGWLSAKSTPQPGEQYLSIPVLQQHPLSRGTVHIVSNDPLQHPAIDPRCYANPLDLELMVKQIEYVKLLAETEPLRSNIEREIDPGVEAVTKEDIVEHLRRYTATAFHAVGSLSMLPQEKNGVVDPQLKVYGTANVRVADISIVPLHVASHTVSIAYMIGEKLADLLKGTVY